jgi:hypothetical protein
MRILRLSTVAAVLFLGTAAVLVGQDAGLTSPRTGGKSWLLGRRQAQRNLNAARAQAPGTLSFRFVSIDVPNASITIASGINPQGDIVGIYFDANFNEHGFLLKDGLFSTIDVPGSLVGVPGSLQTEVNGISETGDIVGDYFAPPGAPGAPACTAWKPDGSPKPECIRGFLYRQGQFSDVLVPGHPGSIPNSITPSGDIYGCVHDFDLGGSMYGFVRLHGGDDFTYKTLMAGGGELANPADSVPVSMNNGATPGGNIIVGLYFDVAQSKARGYVVQNGTFTPYDVPGSTSTETWGINPAAAFVGFYYDANGDQHGFVQLWGAAAPITIDVPNAVLTDTFAINPEGAIVGLYMDSAGNFHGYLGIPAR